MNKKQKNRFKIIMRTISILAVLIWVGLAVWIAIDAHKPYENKVAQIFGEPPRTISPPFDFNRLPGKFWYCCVAAPASFVGVWIIYFVLDSFTRVFQKISNRHKRLAAMWIGIAVIVSMIVFPPVIIQHFSAYSSQYLSGHYEPIWGHYCKIDLARISVQILGVALVTIGLVVTFRGKEK